MGVWGMEPWDNDAACDWFCRVFTETMCGSLETALLSRTPEVAGAAGWVFPPQVRSAAWWMWETFGRNYVWNVDSFGRLSAFFGTPHGDPARVTRRDASVSAFDPVTNQRGCRWLAPFTAQMADAVTAAIAEHSVGGGDAPSFGRGVEEVRAAAWLAHQLGSLRGLLDEKTTSAVLGASYSALIEAYGSFAAFERSTGTVPEEQSLAAATATQVREFETLSSNPWVRHSCRVIACGPEAMQFARQMALSPVSLDEFAEAVEADDDGASLAGLRMLAGLQVNAERYTF